MYPMKLTPPLKSYIWGGKKLKTEFYKETELDCVAESWELSCHKDGSSIIANGELAGMTLPEYIAKKGKAILGENAAGFEEFPLLIKLIDACDNLSVQVHPNNEYALRVEGEYGKTEMWYIVDCEEGASLLYGFTKEVTAEEFARRISDNTLLEITNRVPVKKGDVFFIEAGTLHAIGAGILIAEIQQNSNTTYRVYDYGRVGADLKPRELHIEKAKEVTTLTPPTREPKPQGTAKKIAGGTKTLLSSCEYFTVAAIEVDTSVELEATNESFHAILSLSGRIELKSKNGDLEIKKGETVFLEAGYGSYCLTGKGELLLTTI